MVDRERTLQYVNFITGIIPAVISGKSQEETRMYTNSTIKYRNFDSFLQPVFVCMLHKNGLGEAINFYEIKILVYDFYGFKLLFFIKIRRRKIIL